MTHDEIIRYGLDLCKQELGTDGSIFIPKLINTCYANFNTELKAEYKRGWKDRATQSDLENRTCGNCKYKYIVDSMTTKCRNDNSGCNKYKLKV